MMVGTTLNQVQRYLDRCSQKLEVLKSETTMAGGRKVPSPENAYTGEYPMARFLFAYTNYKPGSKLDPLRREFIKYVFSKQGQEIVVKDGYFPVTAPLATKMLGMVGIK